MTLYKIPVQWEMYGEMEIEADTLQEAIKIAYDSDSGLPEEKLYAEGSFNVWIEGLEYSYPNEKPIYNGEGR